MESGTVAERQAGYLPRNYRIISHRTQRRILHIEDALQLERLRFEIWDYAKGSGALSSVEAYLDAHTARLLASELAAGNLREMDGHKEMGGGTTQGELTSRILQIENTDTRNPIRITVRNGPGARQPGGLISPVKGAPQVSLSVLLSKFDARRIGLAILEHMQAWAVNTYTERMTDGTWQPESTGWPGTAHNADSARGELGDEPVPYYANGEPVGDNAAERQAFDAFARAAQRPPTDVDELRAWARSGGHREPDRSQAGSNDVR